jgi:plastocyanin
VRFAVNPPRISVQAGTPVTWVNIDDVAHQFLVGGADIETEYLLKGQAGTVVLKKPGVYQYGDTFYPATESLQGVIEVRR